LVQAEGKISGSISQFEVSGWLSHGSTASIDLKAERKEVTAVSTALLEIVDRGEGEIVLQRSDSDAEPLVTVTFSDEARIYISDNNLEVAKAMIQAGIQAAAAISERGDDEAQGQRRAPRVVH
jgi:hypothetical protein